MLLRRINSLPPHLNIFSSKGKSVEDLSDKKRRSQSEMMKKSESFSCDKGKKPDKLDFLSTPTVQLGEERPPIERNSSQFTRSNSYKSKKSLEKEAATKYLRERNSDSEARFVLHGRRKSASFSEIDDMKQSISDSLQITINLKQPYEKTMKLTQKNSRSDTKVPQIVVDGSPNDDDAQKRKEQQTLARLAGETDEDARIRLAAIQSRSSRSRSSTVVVIPNASIQMDLHTLYMGSIKNSRKGKTVEDNMKKYDEENDKKSGRFAALMSVFKKEGSNMGMDDFRDFLEYIRRNLIECEPHELSIYKDSHWSSIIQSKDSANTDCISNKERRRFEALWELFHSEVTYLIDHLLVLRNVFSKSYEHARAFGFLQNMDETILFANLEKLVEVTSYFAKNLLKIFTSRHVTIESSTEVISTVFLEFDAVLIPQYYEYCVNYRRAKCHLANLKEDDVFMDLTRWCEQHEFANRLHLEDFLVAPLQHLTKYPLLLKAIRKHTPENDDNCSNKLTATIQSIEESISSTEKKISEVINEERMEQIRETIFWPTFPDNEQKHPLPDIVKSDLSSYSCENILENNKRKLLKEGLLILVDSNKAEIYTFLFDDMILLTKMKKGKIRRNTGSADEKIISSTEPIKEKVKEKKSKSDIEQNTYHVFRQPIPVDRLKVYDIPENTSSSLKNCFCCVHLSRYKQLVHAYTLQASSIEEKHLWMKSLNSMISSLTTNRAPSSGYASDDG